jgi:Na+/glutamate symporter
MKSPDMTAAQRSIPWVRRVATAGAAFGVCCGCLIGAALGLSFIDTESKDREKKQKEMATIVQTIMDHSHDLIGAQWCSLFLVDEVKVSV